MHTHRLSLRTAAFAALAFLGAGAFADVPVRAEIYQQRAADGSIVLTDRPSANAVTERTWQMQHEDAGAAQRAADVRREADAVSERIARQIEAQERRAADADLMRMRLARSTDADDGDGSGYAYGSGYGYAIGVPLFRQFANRRRITTDTHAGGTRRAIQGGSGSSRSGGRGAIGQR